ncbi:MAG TPA: pyridoxal phosphate-dependent aminotransferase [Blastocatellia bacterium]|nr:pyridoxal phosphate-dependent aminotransferase [Blastocatellia bacterium]HAF23345.1 pyridoxal phosphate-dependent aminotransferase [Blastocatellia bacterium]
MTTTAVGEAPALDGDLFPLAARVAGMSMSKTMAVSALADQLRRAGADVIDLGAGEPDFPTPENIRLAAAGAIESGHTKYTAAAGTPNLKQAICERFATDFGVRYDPAEVLAAAGAKQVIFNAIATLIEPGDDVLVPKPYWVTFPEAVTFAGGRAVWVETEDQGFRLTAGAVERALTTRSKLLLINSPSNPSGLVVAPDEFEKIVALAVSRGLWVISDECYCQFVYAPVRPFSATQLPEALRRRVLVAGSLSKTYAMTGWRIGYALGPREWIKAMTCVQSHSTSNPTSISQQAAIEALTGSQDSVAQMLQAYSERRDWLIPALNDLPGVTCATPEGAFYAFPSIKGTGLTSEALTTRLLEEAHVAVTPGDAFGAPGYLRLSYATSLEKLEAGVERIRGVLANM